MISLETDHEPEASEVKLTSARTSRHHLLLSLVKEIEIICRDHVIKAASIRRQGSCMLALFSSL